MKVCVPNRRMFGIVYVELGEKYSLPKRYSIHVIIHQRSQQNSESFLFTTNLKSNHQ